MQTLVVDAGNTNVKLGRFENGQLIDVMRYSSPNEFEAVKNQIKATHPKFVVISSVVSSHLAEEILQTHEGMVVSPSTPIPIANTYETPNTLGMDRLCNAVAVASRMDTEFGVSIDIGTCIKFDIVSKTEGYLGGSIAPGIDLRYKSLNDYTENLPLLSNKSTTSIVGKDTKTSMQSGVMNGMRAEIEGLVSYYESQFQSLTFFVTGGDANFFDIQGKNNIFAVENLTLEGLFEIYKHNA
ncbi:MAG: type III pantothenate kinase [bacterium]|nr:type III pantothenate kinase [bacterium]